MDLQDVWDRARTQTEIRRMQLHDLATFDASVVPYIFLAESSLHAGDTIVRRGQVVIQRPALILPSFSPQFEGFTGAELGLPLSPEMLGTFLLVRGIQFPSLRYRHEHASLDVLEATLQASVDRVTDQLTRAEDIRTGLVIGPEDAWQFSVLLLVGALVVRSAEGDLRRILDKWRKRQPPERR